MNDNKLKLKSFPIWNDQFKKYSGDKLNDITVLNGYTEHLMDRNGNLLSDDNSCLLYTRRPKVFKPKSVLLTLKKEDEERRIETFDITVMGNESVDIKRCKSESLLKVQSTASNKTIGLEEDRFDNTLTQAPLIKMLNKIPVIRLTRCTDTLRTIRINDGPQSTVKCKAPVSNDALQNVNGYEEFAIKDQEYRLVSLERKTASNSIQGTTRSLPNILRSKSSKGLYKTSCFKPKSPESVDTKDDTCNISKKEDYDTQRPSDNTREHLKKSRPKRKQDHDPLDIKQESPNWVSSGVVNKDFQAEKKIEHLTKTKRRHLYKSPTCDVTERTGKQYCKLDFSTVEVKNETREGDVASISNYLSTDSLESLSVDFDEFLLSRENSLRKDISDVPSVAAVGRICSDLENADYMNCLNMEEFITDTDEVHKLLSPTIDGCFDDATYSLIFDANNEKYGINGNAVNQYEACFERNEINNNNLSTATVASTEDRQNLKEFTKRDQTFFRDDLLRLQLAENINNDNYEIQAIESDDKTEIVLNVSTDLEQSIVSNDDCEKSLDSTMNQFHYMQTDLDSDLYLLCNEFDFFNGLYIADDKDNLLPENIDDILSEDCIYDNDLLRRSETVEYIENDRPQQYGVRDCLIQSYNFQGTIRSLSTGVDQGTRGSICDRNKDGCESDIDVLDIDDFHSREFEVRKNNSIISSSWALSNMNELDYGKNKLKSLLPNHFDDDCENNELKISGSSTIFDRTTKQLSGINEEWLMRNENLEGTSTSCTTKKIDGSCVDLISARNSSDGLNKENFNVGHSRILGDLFWKNKAKPNKSNLKLRNNKSLLKHNVKTLHKTKSSHVNSRKIFTCGRCLKMYSGSNALKKHVKLHDNYSLTCETCNKHFSKKSSLMRHVNDAHPDRKTRVVS